MTEIPEHLLKRSRDRRSALGLGGDGESDGGDAAPATTASSAPAAPASTGPVQRAAAPEPAAPEPPKPDTPVVASYKARRKVPFWAMAALGVLPLWGLMYARAVTEQAEEAAGPLGIGAEVYSNCASCHGAGGGGAGPIYGFTGGAVLETFPNIEDMLRWIYFGTGEYNLAGVEIYGNPDREGGPHITGAGGNMPGWGEDIGGALPDYRILAVTCHERYALGGADPDGEWAEEFETWCSEESEIWADLEAGGHLSDLHERFEGIMPIGDMPIPGSPAAE